MRLPLLSFIFMILILSHAAAIDRGITITIPNNISLTQQEIIKHLPQKAVAGPDSETAIEITIYYFSRGIETLSYSAGSPIASEMKNGSIKALIKLKEKKRLKRAIFISASGGSREEILINFGIRLKKIMRRL